MVENLRAGVVFLGIWFCVDVRPQEPILSNCDGDVKLVLQSISDVICIWVHGCRQAEARRQMEN